MISVSPFIFYSLLGIALIVVVFFICLTFSAIRYRKTLRQQKAQKLENIRQKEIKKLNNQIVELTNDVLALRLQFNDFQKKIK